MTHATYDQLAAIPPPDGPEAALELRLTRWQSALVALGSLLVIFAIAFGVMVGGGEVVRALDSSRRINVFAAFHDWWVIGALLGITVLWLLPPHPWAKRAIAPLALE